MAAADEISSRPHTVSPFNLLPSVPEVCLAPGEHLLFSLPLNGRTLDHNQEVAEHSGSRKPMA